MKKFLPMTRTPTALTVTLISDTGLTMSDLCRIFQEVGWQLKHYPSVTERHQTLKAEPTFDLDEDDEE